MPLPVTKSAVNRLGDRLIASDASDAIAEADLEELAVVLTAYQRVLEQVKAELRDMGFAATARVKTTGTLVDKLRRSHGMRLSRMQDMAGARIVVPDVVAQDDASARIHRSFAVRGWPCKLVDRRMEPSFGYRAVHVVAQVDGMPVEIQIRTELQDAWAQIVERLGDRWGRGIRYGQDPDSPDARVRSGKFLLTTRRGAVEVLMQLSEVLADVEKIRTSTSSDNRMLEHVVDLLKIWNADERDNPQRWGTRIPPDVWPSRDSLLDLMDAASEPADQELIDAGPDMTWEQLARLAELCHVVVSRKVSDRAKQVQESEQRLRDILQLIADATDEGE